MQNSLITKWGKSAGALALSTLLLHGTPATAAPSLKVVINGRTYADELVRIENSRLLVPLRAIAEALGASVAWNENDRSITLSKDGRRTTLWVDSFVAVVDGKYRPLEVPARIVADRTVVPYRFVGESLGARVGWDGTTRTAYFWSNLKNYTVQPGDSAWLISQRHGLTVGEFRLLNGLPDDRLTTGSAVQVPAAQSFQTVSGYTVVAGWNDTASLESVRTYGNQLTDIAMVSHRLTADGQMTGSIQAQTMQSAREQAIRPWLVVQNLDASGQFSRAIVEQFLGNPAARRRFIGQSVSLLQAHGLTGIEIDFEDLPLQSRPFFVQFLSELKAALEPDGFKLSVAVPAKTADDRTNLWSGPFDYVQIGRIADRVMLMTYDENWFGGPSGPVASLPWVKRVLEYATRVITPEKILLGLAGYGYDWPQYGGSGRSISAQAAERLGARHGTQWDSTSSTPFIRYRDAGGTSRIVWFENERSWALKRDLARSFGVQGIAIWRLGMETADQWRHLAAR